MTVTEVKNQVIAETQNKIQQMKQRDIPLPEKLIDRCALCDQLSQEIYDYAVCALKQIIDRNHLSYDPEVLENSLHEDVVRLSGAAVEVLFSRQARIGKITGQQNFGSGKKRLRFATINKNATNRPAWLSALMTIKPSRLTAMWLSGLRKRVFGFPSKVMGNHYI